MPKLKPSFCSASEINTPCAPCPESPDDALHEACGVFGIWAPDADVARLTFFGLQALQHRGQESAGIAVSDGVALTCEKGLGLAREVFDDATIAALQGQAAVGHVRYSTSGKDPDISLQMAQPLVALDETGGFALAHNGTLTNTADLLEAMSGGQETSSLSGVCATSAAVSDTQIATDFIAHFARETKHLESALERFMHTAQGAYSIVVLAPDALYALRDFSGIRPLCLGELPGKGGFAIASETCAFDLVGATYLRDIAPGELVRIDSAGIHSKKIANEHPHLCARPAQCLFEYVYFARPDSVIDSANVYRAREAMGRRLFHEAPVEADIVIGVPDSGIPAAIGYARESGVVYSEGLIRNRYVDRTFIEPTQELREQGIRIKLNPLHYAVRNRRIIVVDDSIVRGSTSKQLVQMLRNAGAAEVHLRITSPAIVWPCFLGINTDTQGQLIAATQSVEEICDYIGADSLAYLSLEGLKSCIYAEHPQYCTACFDGNYPMPKPNPLHADAFLPGYKPTWNND